MEEGRKNSKMPRRLQSGGKTTHHERGRRQFPIRDGVTQNVPCVPNETLGTSAFIPSLPSSAWERQRPTIYHSVTTSRMPLRPSYIPALEYGWSVLSFPTRRWERAPHLPNSLPSSTWERQRSTIYHSVTTSRMPLRPSYIPALEYGWSVLSFPTRRWERAPHLPNSLPSSAWERQRPTIYHSVTTSRMPLRPSYVPALEYGWSVLSFPTRRWERAPHLPNSLPSSAWERQRSTIYHSVTTSRMPLRPSYVPALEYGQSIGFSTNPARTGLAWIY